MPKMHPELAGAVLLEAVADSISESEGKKKIVRAVLNPVVKILKGKYGWL